MPRLKRLSIILIAMGLAAGQSSYAQQPQPDAPGPAIDIKPSDFNSSQAVDPAPEVSATDLAKKLQNPVGDLISVPFQNNTNFNVGPHKGTQDILNIEPVIPIHITSEWNIITRTILPLVWQPSFAPAHTVPFGTGPITFSAFLSPRNAVGGWVWGAGPVLQVPSISDKSLGSNIWGAGPTAVVVKMAGPIVAGALVNNVFSLGGTSGPGSTRYNLLTFQPFFNYNFDEGWYVGTSPLITANWYAASGKWTLPVGGQVGRVIKIGGKLPVNLRVEAYYFPLRPQFGATWQLITQIAIIF